MTDDPGISISLDNRPLQIREGTTLRDLLPDLDPAFAVCLMHPVEEEVQETGQLRLETTVGELIIDITDPEWYGAIERAVKGTEGGLALRWQDRQAAAFGPFECDFTPARTPSQYRRGDVILGCGGYDPERSFLVFSRRIHTADHGAGPGGGVIGKIVRGMSLIDHFSSGDAITGGERVTAMRGASRACTTTDRSITLTEGMRIYSRIEVVAEGYNPPEIDTDLARSVEFLMISLEEGRCRVDRSSTTHIQDCRLRGFSVPSEFTGPRSEGAITFRTDGMMQGCMYIYTTDTARTGTHTVVGRVRSGIELAAAAKKGDLLRVDITPRRLDFVGMTLAGARERGAENGIRVIAEEDAEDDRMVVGCDPSTTLEILAAGEVRATTVPTDKVITIRLDDEHAPETCRYFRTITGLFFHRVGTLPFTFKLGDLYLFQPPSHSRRECHIKPENTPRGEVPASVLAVTNDSRKSAGMIGVRLSASTEFGPTAEPFDGTNCIGEVRDPEKLEYLEEGSRIYIIEERA